MRAAPFALYRTAPHAASDGRHDFDFLIGRWRVAHGRLQRRLEGDTQWDSFAGTAEMRPILGGLGNIEGHLFELPRQSGCSLLEARSGRSVDGQSQPAPGAAGSRPLRWRRGDLPW